MKATAPLLPILPILLLCLTTTSAQAQPGNATTSTQAQTEIKEAIKRVEDTLKKIETQAAVSSGPTKLLEFGVTAGVSAGVSIVDVTENNLEMTNAVGGFVMPYVAAFPAYWFRRPELNKYCASEHSNGALASQKAADASAKERSGYIFEELVSLITKTSSTSKTSTTAQVRLDEIVASQLKESLPLFDRYINASSDEKATLKALLIAEISKKKLGWTIGVGGNCRWYKIGFVMGVPLSTSRTFRFHTARFDAGIDSILGLGLTYTPNAYFSIILGWALSQIGSLQTTSPTDDQRMAFDEIEERFVHQYYLSIGGNADLVGLLTGG